MKSLQRTSLSELTYEALKEQILDQKLAPGARLNIDALTRSLGVSSSPVRARLEKEIVAALQAPEFRQRIEASVGTLVSIENAATLEARIRRESEAWAKLIKAAKVDLQ